MTDSSSSRRPAMTTTSTASSQSPASPAVLVTAPRCIREESDGAIRVERVRAQSIDLTHSPAAQRTTMSSSRKLEASLPPKDLMLFGSNELDSRYVQRTGQDEPENDKSTGAAATNSSGVPSHSSSNSTNGTPAAPPILALDVSTTTTAAVLSNHSHDNDDDDDDGCPITYVLGKPYHPKYDYALKRTDESSLFWFTYRCDFPTIHPYNITTDAGWGCMLRSAQMMLGQVLRLHYKTREWVIPPTKRQNDAFLRLILTYFADFASTENVFSLHNMVAAGLSKYETLPGEWYGPGTACHVMRDLVHLQEERENKKRRDEPDDDTTTTMKPFFRVHVASQGSVYRDAVEELMTRDAQKEHERSNTDDETPASHPLPSHPLDPAYDTATKMAPKLAWDTALLILIPLRLGLKVFNEEYAVPLAHVFSFRQSVGVLGGRPRGARWFYGADSDGSKLYGLDPHTIQAAPQRKVVSDNGTRKRVVALTEDYIRSVHTTYPETIPLHRMDPSLALGFYCRDRSEFEDLCASVLEFQRQHRDMPEMFTVADAVPDYSANVSSVMNEMMMADGIADSFALDEEGHVSDEDEYVML